LKLDHLIEKIQQLSGNYYAEDRLQILQKKIENFLRKNNLSIDEIFLNEERTSLFIDNVLVNETSFFRHYQQLEEFRELYLKPLVDKGEFRILSAGCSTGKEVYTLAMMAMETGSLPERKLFEGMDLSRFALSVARKGVYSKKTLNQIPQEYRKYISTDGEYLYISEKIKKLTEFTWGNILDLKAFPENHYDVIFCRNVFIYFNPEYINYVLYNFRKALKKDGVLVVSPVEFLSPENHKLFRPEKIKQYTFYRRVG